MLPLLGGLVAWVQIGDTARISSNCFNGCPHARNIGNPVVVCRARDVADAFLQDYKRAPEAALESRQPSARGCFQAQGEVTQ